MKKMLITCLFIMISIFMITGCVGYSQTDKRIYEKINTNISNCSIKVDSDKHGVFHGDGHYFVKAQCQDDFDKEIKKAGTWKELPLTENLELIMYGGEKDNKNYGYELAVNVNIKMYKNGKITMYKKGNIICT